MRLTGIIDGVYREWDIPDPDAVPADITPLQARRHLRALGMKAQADAYLATCPEEVQEAWEFCIAVERNDPFLHGAAVALVGEEQADAWLDDFFRAAKTIRG